MSIAEGTVIENAVGGNGGETFIGNPANNAFWGNGGKDIFIDSPGSDTYYGGTDIDTVKFIDPFETYTNGYNGEFITVGHGSEPNSIDYIDSTVEYVDFGGESWTYASLLDFIQTNGAPSINKVTTNQQTPLISGTAILNPGESLTIEVNDEIFDNVVVLLDRSWSIQLSNRLNDGIYDIVATISGDGHLRSDITLNELVIDTVSPTKPVVNVLPPTNNTTPKLTGQATIGLGETLTVSVGNQIFSDVAVVSGKWEVTPLSLTDGTYDVQAVVMDQAGNMSTDITIAELTVDTTPPPCRGSAG